MDSANIVTVLVSLAGSGVLLAIVQGIFARRKTHAEAQGAGAAATKTITDAAAGVVAVLQADNAALRAELVVMRLEMNEFRRWRNAAEEQFDEHDLWDDAVRAELARLGGRVDPPPPLRPNLRLPVWGSDGKS